eukprot:2501455-Pleurochrysis_carterae.AAC.1
MQARCGHSELTYNDADSNVLRSILKNSFYICGEAAWSHHVDSASIKLMKVHSTDATAGSSVIMVSHAHACWSTIDVRGNSVATLKYPHYKLIARYLRYMLMKSTLVVLWSRLRVEFRFDACRYPIMPYLARLWHASSLIIQR